MKKIFSLSILILLGGNSNAMAANLAVITSPPTMLNFVVLGIAVGCIISSFKILSLLKGGNLFKSWQIFMIGFIVLALSQTGNLLNDFEIFSIPSFVIPALLALTFGLFLYGIIETKKVLG